MKIPFTTIAQGTSSGYQNADQLIIDTPEQWEQLWQEYTSDVIPPVETPPINFTENSIIAVFSGEKPTSGYGVEIVSVESRATSDCDLTRLIIRVHYCFPDSITQDVITHPYHIIQLPQISAPQVFFEEA
jgi:hypothetical protein